MRAEIRRIVDESGITTIYVTHDQKEALSLADSMLVMRDGKVVQRGHPRELYQRPNSRFTAEFLGETNFLEGEILSSSKDAREVQTPDGVLHSAGHEDAPEKGMVSVSIRPEAMRMLLENESAPDGWSTLTTTHRGSSFLGETAQHDLLTAKGVPLKALELRPRHISDQGAPIRVAIAPEDVVLLTE